MGGASSPPGQSYLLDSSVLIPSLRGDNAITARIASIPAAYVSSIVLGELYFGAYGSPTRQEAALQDIAINYAEPNDTGMLTPIRRRYMVASSRH